MGVIMSRLASFLSLATLLFFAAFGLADEAEPADAGVNLDGFVYMGIIPVNEQGPDPSAESRLPYYFAFGQEGNSLYGSVVLADSEKLSAPPAKPVNITLTQWAIVDGEISGNEFTCGLVDTDGKDLGFGLRGEIKNGGDQIDLYITYTVFEIGPFYIYRCNNDGEYYSGIYVGQGDFTDTAPAEDINNILLGVLVRDNGKMAFTSLLYDPANPGERYNFFDEADDFDPETGIFVFEGDKSLDEPDVDGYIGGGVIDLVIEGVDGSKAEATLYFFETNNKKMKLKKPAPKKVAKGKDTTIKLKHRYALRGAHVSQNNPGVRINWYRYYSKYLLINLDVDSKASGKIKLSVTSPLGRKVLAKKQIRIN